MKYIASYAGALGGVDGIAFAGGIGENAPVIRARTLLSLAGLGIRFDEELNRALRGEEGEISPPGSTPRVFVVPTNEEILIARDTMMLVSGKEPS
jgi:acetate kinase